MNAFLWPVLATATLATAPDFTVTWDFDAGG
jgi:hypothetical protein